MISRMRTDIVNLKNAKMRKDIFKHTIGIGYIWFLIWLLNESQNNHIGEYISLAIIFFVVLGGCITAFVVRKHKRIFILFRAISLWMMSFGFLSIAYTSYYVFLKFKSILFLGVTLVLYLLIFITILIKIKNKAKHEQKRKKGKNNEKILIAVVMTFCIGCSIIVPIRKQLNQLTIHVVGICLGILLSYTLVALSSYYLVEYMISKKYTP